VKLFLKITTGIVLIGLISFWIMAEAFGWGIGFAIDSKRSWNKVKDLPIVSAMGHWSENPFQETFLLEPNPFPKDIRKTEWVKAVEADGFKILENEGGCDIGVYAIDFMQKYDSCAMKIIGPRNCSYSYYVAANFEESVLTDVVGVRSHFICL